MVQLSKIYDFIKSKMECSIIYGQNSESTCVHTVIKLDEHNDNQSSLFWVNQKNINKTANLKTGILLAPSNYFTSVIRNVPFDGTLISCENPRKAFSLILKEFFVNDIGYCEYNPTKYYESVNIGAGTIIEHDVIIGKNVKIGYNNVIISGTIIGDNVKIGSNNTIGGIGFGYEKNYSGQYEAIPHIGNVIIENNVEIGNNNCIDRAVLGSTILCENCKIDNLVHIAHGVTIGKNSLIIANSMIAGSATIGENTWIAPSTSVINGGKIGNNSMTGLGAVVIKDIEDNSLAVGIPAKKIKDI